MSADKFLLIDKPTEDNIEGQIESRKIMTRIKLYLHESNEENTSKGD